MNNDYIVIICAYNCQNFIVEAVQSVAVQKEVDYGIIVVDDASTDDTVKIVKNLMEHNPKIRLVENKTRTRSAAWNQYQAVKKHVTNPNSVICIVDGDDYLLDEVVLKRLDMFRNGVVPMHAGCTHIKLNTNQRLVHGFSDIRRKWGPYHMRFFRAYMYDAVPEEQYYKDGELIGPASDYAFIFSVLDILGENNWLTVNIIAYMWRYDLEGHNDHLVNRDEQKANTTYLLNREPLPQLTEEQLEEIKNNF
jgi:glycosyltransferase involved in cell wall biosynthesis